MHVHLVTNTVSFEDGHKLHNSKKDLELMKEFTNQMCEERGLTVAQKGKDFYGQLLEEGHVSGARTNIIFYRMKERKVMWWNVHWLFLRSKNKAVAEKNL